MPESIIVKNRVRGHQTGRASLSPSMAINVLRGTQKPMISMPLSHEYDLPQEQGNLNIDSNLKLDSIEQKSIKDDSRINVFIS